MIESARTPDAAAAPGRGSDWTRPLHRIFESHAARTPDAVALVDGEQRVTYRALNRRANQLARRLVDRGVQPGDHVAVCTERSAAMIVGILATLKAGASYIPIDARFPASRVEWSSAPARLVLTDAQTRHLLPDGDARALEVDLRDAELFRGPGGDLHVETPVGQPAYLMYTSGSTGQPKGVLVSHRNVARLLAACVELYPLGRDDVWTFFHSISFDFSVWEIFGALLTGGRLVVTPYWTARSPDRFADLLRREGVTVLSQTPSAFQQLLSFGKLVDGPASPALRWVVFGGEAFHMRPLLAYAPALREMGVTLVNMYGITETTVHVTHRVMREEDGVEDRSPIGRALPHLRVHLLDPFMHPVPDGVAGEIYVGGDGVALGYAAAPRTTAERFVPSPFPGDAGERLYRSGDLARALGAEDMEYLGRGDPQVKVRGYRIEPGEVRFHLLRHPRVQDALVTTVQDAAGDHALAAYVIPAGGGDLPLEELVAHLRAQLPEHMVPTLVHVLDRFPLTPNGKVDVAALRARAEGEARPQRLAPPRTWEQQVIADVWRDALGLPAVGIHDDFFTIGGDSIKALRVSAHLRSLGLDVSVEAVFGNPTVSALARRVAEAAEGEPGPAEAADDGTAGPAAPLPVNAVDAYPLAHLQLGMLFHTAESDHDVKPYHNVSLFKIQGRFDEGRFRRAVERLMAQHPVLRTAFEMHATRQPQQVVYRQIAPPVTVQSLEGLPEAGQRAAIERWLEVETKRQFSYHRAPLVRFHVAVCSDDLFYLGLTEHHSILDGWSVASLLTQLFETFLDGQGPQPHAEPYASRDNVFRRHILLERQALADPVHQAFWTDHLGDLARIRLPSESPDGDGAAPGTPLVGKVRVSLDESLSEGLRSLARETQVPFKSVLLAIHLSVLEFITNSRDTVTGVITHARPEMEGGDTALGLFLNTLPFRITHGNTSWREWLRAVFTEEKRTLPFRRFPLAAMRDPAGRRPDLETAFNYNHFHVYDRLDGDAPLRVLETVIHETTDFDLLTDFTVLTRSTDLDLTLSYNTRRFSRRQMETIAGYYLRCAELMVQDPAASSCTPALDGAPAAPAPPADAEETTLQALLAAARDPAQADRIALVDEGRHLTYRALCGAVDRLAGCLDALEVQAEVPVAVLLDKSLEYVASALAVFQAGGVFVPVDPADPPERVNYVIGNSGARIVITDARGAGLLTDAGLTVISVQHLARLRPPAAAPRARPEIHPENLAYMIYTSGSTGRPKGVAMHRRGIANLMQWQRREMPIHGRRVLQYSSLGFDVSVQEILTALTGGNTLVVIPSSMRRDFPLLARRMAEEQVECLFAPDTPIQALMIAAASGGIRWTALRTVVQAGEALRVGDELRRFMEEGGRLYNHYGPTETHVVTAGRVDPAAPGGPSLGREIDHTDIHVVDSWLRVCPPGTIGEMHIAGANVARAYHADPRLTADRFRPRAHGGAPGERVFKTGDLGYRDARGELQFTGRADSQVKVRGYRIELEEVRLAFLRHPAVKDAVASVAGPLGERDLCVHVVSEQEIDPAALRRFVGTALPSYMVPAHVAFVASIPMTRNGKVDRASLPAIDRTRPARPRAFSPRDEVEATLLSVWREVLGSGRGIAEDDDFMEIGGNSLSLLQLQLRILSRFSLDVRLSELVMSSSFEKMALMLRRALEARGPREPTHGTGVRPAHAPHT